MAKTRIFDFTGVEDRAGNFRPKRKPEGDYYAHITAVDDHTSKDDNEGWVFTIKVDGDNRSAYPYYVMFDDKQAWKPRTLCIATGQTVPSKRVKLNPNTLVGKALGIALEDDEYEGRVKSTIAAVFPLEELSDARNEPSGKASSAKAKSRKAEEEDDEDEDDEEDEPVAKKSKAKRAPEPDDDEDEDEDDEPPAKSKSKKSKGKAKKVEPEDDDEEDDEDDQPPAKKSKAKSKKSSKKSKSDDDEDEELDLDDL